MDTSRLIEDIRRNLESAGFNLTKAEVQELYTSVLANISETLDEGNILDIENFGSFWRKKGGSSMTTFFKPTEEILERINK